MVQEEMQNPQVAKLSKRNQQYVFDLTKALKAANLSSTEIKEELAEIISTLAEGQKTGMTARQLYGTVAECATQILEKPEPVAAATWWQLYLDNTLIMFTILAGMMGLMRLISKNTQSVGLVTVLVSAIFGGGLLYLMYELIYKYERPGADRSQKPKLWKSSLIMVLATFIWIVCFSVTSLIPVTFNPILDPFVMIILAALAFGARYLFKKKYNYQGTIFSR